MISEDDEDIEELANVVRNELGGDDEEEEEGEIQRPSSSVSRPSSSVSKPSSSRKKRSPSPKAAPSTKKTRVKTGGKNWTILETIWPANERPEALQDPEWIENQTIGDLMALQKVYLKKETKEQGQAIGRATRDVKPPVVTFGEEEDDCDEKLASSRWQRMPVSGPSNWYHKVPIKINHQYRNIPMKHILGTDSAVAPTTILARHNRANALMMKHFFWSNANITSKPMKEIRSRDSTGIATISDYDWVVPTSIK